MPNSVMLILNAHPYVKAQFATMKYKKKSDEPLASGIIDEVIVDPDEPLASGTDEVIDILVRQGLIAMRVEEHGGRGKATQPLEPPETLQHLRSYVDYLSGKSPEKIRPITEYEFLLKMFNRALVFLEDADHSEAFFGGPVGRYPMNAMLFFSQLAYFSQAIMRDEAFNSASHREIYNTAISKLSLAADEINATKWNLWQRAVLYTVNVVGHPHPYPNDDNESTLQIIQDPEPSAAEDLILAIQRGNSKQIERCVRADVEMNSQDAAIKDERGWTLLHFAVKYNYPRLISYLYALSVDPNAETKATKSTVLHMAASVRNDDCMRELLNNGAIKTSPIDAKFHTPLYYAIVHGMKTKTEYLMDFKAELTLADIYESDGEGRTLLHYAAYYGFEGVAKYLIDKGADPNSRAREARQTPLHYAVIRGHKKIVDLLLTTAPTTNALLQDDTGKTAYDYIFRHEVPDSEMIALFDKHIAQESIVSSTSKLRISGM